MPADQFLPAIGHAVSGATGTAISTTATYPLDLINTRLKVQRQLRKDGTISPSEQYAGITDAISRIYEREGGLRAFYAGLGSDIFKGVADSFLFFLFYNWFRTRRSQGNSRRLPAWEELAVGAAAGACARLFTTPISNVVTRKQTASLISDDNDAGGEARAGARAGAGAPDTRRGLSSAEILHVIHAEKGLLGLWAGYSATLVLTLNPSITFYLQHALKKALVDRGREGESNGATFLVAALSKAIATAVTYPFQIAKARVQVSAPESPRPRPEPEPEDGGGEEKKEVVEASTEARGEDIIVVEQNVGRTQSKAQALARRVQRLAEDTIFGTVMHIRKTEGVSALYDGIGGELLKAFFNHGTTMLSKEIVHRLILQLYFSVLARIRTSPTAQALLRRRSREELKKLGDFQISERFARIKDGTIVMGLLERTQRLIISK
ncbi:peroxisomal adenine nucleotide transporter 1 [Diaporthe helianthi]|uniref:Peroxisomal adenine nucleotide transporter 1 n=1 Tax=Diaporthe helianthi TaxID=158607 RepID=A0A2P5HQL1_DIAHE|nr:peroxisomal adenine nucleotide transporter 1 [Diaporthe helianthi]